MSAIANAASPDREVVDAAGPAPVLPIGGRKSQVLRHHSAQKTSHVSHFHVQARANGTHAGNKLRERERARIGRRPT